jgi:hypothetical protein
MADELIGTPGVMENFQSWKKKFAAPSANPVLFILDM